jgi:hypothetical protein
VEKAVRLFRSFEEADQADLKERMRMTPQERMRVMETLRPPMPLSKDLCEFLGCLNVNDVDYLIPAR